MVGGARGVEHGRRLEVGALGVLPLSLVGVLVAAEGLGGGEVPAAVMALEFTAVAAPAVGGVALGVCTGGGGGGEDVNFNCVGVGVGALILGGGVLDLYAEEANGRLLLGRSRADERQLGEGIHVHEVSCCLYLLHGNWKMRAKRRKWCDWCLI